MKKLISLTLCICLLMALSACKNEDTAPNNNTGIDPNGTASSTDTSVPALTYPYPMTVVSTPVITETSLADDGTAIFTYTYQNLSLILDDPTVAEQIEVDFLNRVDFTATGASSVYLAAVEDYAQQSDWNPYFYSTIYNTARLDQSILSMHGTTVSFDGSPRAAAVSMSLTYDLLTGKALTLREILVADYSADTLCGLILSALAPYADSDTLFFDYDAIISDMFLSNTPVENWYFSGTGLCFYFSPGEIAPGSAGSIVAEIPYENLNGTLADVYFPGEQVAYDGELLAKPFSDADQDGFSQFAEVLLDESAGPLLLYTEGTLLNVRLELGIWSEDHTVFTPEATIFAAEALTDGDGVLLYAAADQLSSMRLTYEASGQTQTQDSLLFYGEDK